MDGGNGEGKLAMEDLIMTAGYLGKNNCLLCDDKLLCSIYGHETNILQSKILLEVNAIDGMNSNTSVRRNHFV